MNSRTLPTPRPLPTLPKHCAQVPAFEDEHRTPAAPQSGGKVLPDRDARTPGSSELQAGDTPNFAARFTVARWRGGAGCFRFVAIGAPSGKAFQDMPFATPDFGFTRDSEEHRFAGVTRARPDCARRRYRWNRAQFVLRHTAAVE